MSTNAGELFTQADCVEILNNLLSSRHQSGRLLDSTLEAERGTVGYLGDYFHLTLSYQLDDEETIQNTRLFVKAVGYCANSVFYNEKLAILRKESTLYNTLLNELRKLTNITWCAECYLTKENLFVMQNLADLGYEPVKNVGAFLNRAQLSCILKGLATMHASSIAYEEKNDINIGEQLKDVLFEPTVSSAVGWFKAGLRAVSAVISEHPTYQTKSMQEFVRVELPSIFEEVYEMVNPSSTYRNVFCQRDPWGGNVFFNKTKPEEVPAAFVDFQLCRYSPPSIDVLMAIYLNLRPRERIDLMPQLCGDYYAQFEKVLRSLNIDANDHMSWRQFEASLRDLQLFGALYNCICATILRVPDGYLTNLKHNSPEAFHRYTQLDRTAEVLELVENNEEYSKYFYECIEDLMELVINRVL